MVYNTQDYLEFGLYPPLGILKATETQRYGGKKQIWFPKRRVLLCL